jgi:hypothetical protein
VEDAARPVAKRDGGSRGVKEIGEKWRRKNAVKEKRLMG